jgi:hypothetical protein
MMASNMGENSVGSWENNLPKFSVLLQNICCNPNLDNLKNINNRIKLGHTQLKQMLPKET